MREGHAVRRHCPQDVGGFGFADGGGDQADPGACGGDPGLGGFERLVGQDGPAYGSREAGDDLPVGGGPGGDFQGVGQQLGDDGQHSPGGRDKQAFQGDGDVLDRGPPVVSERRGGALDAGDQAPLYPAVELVESRAGFLADPADDFRDDGQEGLPEPGGQVREGGFEDLDLVGEGVSLAAELAVEVPGLFHDERERGGLGGLVGQGPADLFEAELGRPRLDRGLLEAHAVALDRVSLALEGRGDGLDGLGGRAAEPGR